jgi:hypothetical protein
MDPCKVCGRETRKCLVCTKSCCVKVGLLCQDCDEFYCDTCQYIHDTIVR